MKCSALNVDFNGVRLDTLASRTSIRAHQIWVPPWKRAISATVDYNLARERLQIDTDLLRIVTSTADELSGGTNIDDLERPWTPKICVLSDLFAILGCDAHLEWIFAEIYWSDRPRQPAYKIKLMLWRVSWALAQISCSYCKCCGCGSKTYCETSVTIRAQRNLTSPIIHTQDGLC